MSPPTAEQILDCPMSANDSGANTVRGYLCALLRTLWDEEEGFSGKRPFGNSGWSWDVYAALIAAGYAPGKVDEDGYIEDFNAEQQGVADALIHSAINALAALGGV